MSFAPLATSWLGTERTPSDDGAPIAGGFEGEHVLVPLLTPEVPAITDQIKVATTLARASGASLSVINPITVPEQTPKEYYHEVAGGDDRVLLDWALDQVAASTPTVSGGLLYGRHLVKTILRAVAANEVDTLVLPGESPGGFLRREVTERIGTHAECDVIVVNGRPGYDAVASILLPIAGGPHSGLAADVAHRIAVDCDAWIDVLHVIEVGAPDHRREMAEEYVDAAYHRIARPETTTTWVLEADDPIDAIIEQSRYYGLTVIGAPTKGRLRQFLSGSTNRSVRANARSVILSARNDG